MAVYIIPTSTELESYTLQVDLDGVTYELDLSWNTRDEAWYLSIADELGNPITSGLRLAIDVPILRSISNPLKPAGSLITNDTSNTGQEAGLNELGERVLLMYVSVA